MKHARVEGLTSDGGVRPFTVTVTDDNNNDNDDNNDDDNNDDYNDDDNEGAKYLPAERRSGPRPRNQPEIRSGRLNLTNILR